MVARVQQELGRLATAPEAQLQADLEDLLGRPPRPRSWARAHPAGRGPRPAGRPADHDHPRLLSVAAQALSARGGRGAPFRGARPAQRRRSAARGAGGGAGEQPQRHPRRARPSGRAARRGDPGRGPECPARGPAPPRRGAGASPRRGRAADRGRVRRARRARRRQRRAGAPRRGDRPGARSARPARRRPRARRAARTRTRHVRRPSPTGSPPSPRSACAPGPLRMRLSDQGPATQAAGSRLRRAPSRRRQPRCVPSRRACRLGRAREGRGGRRAHGGAAADRRGGARRPTTGASARPPRSISTI